MENENQGSKRNLYIILIMCILLAIVCVLAIIILKTMNVGQPEPTQMAADTPTPTPQVTENYTQAPIVTVPVGTPAPESTPFAAVTMTFDEDAVWINLSHLVIRPQPDFETEKIGNIPYGTKVMGEIDGNWMYTSYNGVEGYIYIGKMKSNDRPCVVYSASDLQPLD